MNESETKAIDTADLVLHGPSGEKWVVAYVQNGYLAWCGWPQGEAKLSDCTLIEAANDEQRVKLLKEMADMQNDDPRRRYARWRLGIRAAHSDSASARRGKP